MEITKYYKESNEIENVKDDYVEIKMSYDNYLDLFFLLEGIRIKRDLGIIKLNSIEKDILEEMRATEVKEVWY